jgi:hypothetical protein
MLVAKIDELVAMTTRDLDEIKATTDQLEPDGTVMPGSAHHGSGDARRGPPAGSRRADRRARRIARRRLG